MDGVVQILAVWHRQQHALCQHWCTSPQPSVRCIGVFAAGRCLLHSCNDQRIYGSVMLTSSQLKPPMLAAVVRPTAI